MGDEKIKLAREEIYQKVWSKPATLLCPFGGVARFWDHECVPAHPRDTDHEPWAGHVLRRRLHASGDGNFVAVVNDYGRYGQVMDLRSGEVTLALDGGPPR